MKSGRVFLLMFLLPVLGVAGVAMLINMGALYGLKQQHSAGIVAQKHDLELLNEATSISESMAAIQRRVANLLQQADAGGTNESAIYRVHGEVVDVLAKLTQRVQGLSGSIETLSAGSGDGPALVADYENYRNYVIMATDIAAIDPKIAGQHIAQARDHFVAFSQRAHHITSQLSKNVEDSGTAAAATFVTVFYEIIGVVVTGLLLMLALSVNAARGVARRMTILANALGQLAHEKASPPLLPDIDHLATEKRGEFSELAEAVLSFRQALIDRHLAEVELLQHKENLEVQVAARTAELLDAKKAAEEANRSKSAFLANMSHEIRTPMNAIIGLNHLIRRDAVNPQQIDRLGKVSHAAQHLLGVINDILDFSKIEAGKLTIDVDDFELDRIFGRLSDLISDRAAEKQLELIIRVDPELPTLLRGDKLRLDQILLNLASNAIKFADTGSITFRARLLAQDENIITTRFEVSDSGIGLTEEQCGRLFKAFEQADSSTTRKFGGTGLGLAICKRLVELMGGQIGVVSTLGKGSTFWFEVPLLRALRTESSPRYQTLPASLNVLVVDDVADAREAMSQMLVAFDAHVTCADSGESALALAQKAIDAGTPFDLVLMDWAMPGMDGIEVSHRMVNLGASPPPKIILATAFGRDWSAERLLDAGIVAQLNKPVTPSSLHDAIISALAGQKIVGANNATTGSDNKPLLDLSPLQGRRVLVAEDNPINQEVARALLEEVGLHVDAADDGVQALQKAMANEYDVILMDMQMPHMDGIAATRAIRGLPAKTSIPIIAMTANAFAEDREACLAAGMNDHVAKPVDPDRLYATLLQWIPVNKSVPSDAMTRKPTPVPLPQQNPIWDAVQSIEGLSAEAGLQGLGGRLPIYLRLLGQFANGNDNRGELIHSALLSGQLVEAEFHAHSLKGVAGSLGAKQVQQLAATVEAALKKGDPESLASAATTMDTLKRELERLIADLRRVLAMAVTSSSDARTTTSRDDLQEVATKLKALLAKDDLEALHYFEHHRSDLEQLLGAARTSELSKRVSQFSYEQAIELMEDTGAG